MGDGGLKEWGRLVTGLVGDIGMDTMDRMDGMDGMDPGRSLLGVPSAFVT